ncbi:MAG: hypothetical protein KJO82_13595 [Gammaproteobacteria bacterium]|nr:hypothetical protein [Gammaproteobacteria bacterium]
MSSNSKNFAILFGVMLPSALASYLYLHTSGFSDDNLIILLKLTARLSFLIYLVIFIARPLRQMLANRLTRWLVKERRSLGIAFAAMHTVHLGLIFTLHDFASLLARPILGTAVGATAYSLMYLMLITSFDAPARAIGPKNWRRLHKTGLFFIGFVFVATLLPEPGQPVYTMDRAWFTVLTGGAIVVRLTAWLALRSKHSGSN